ncbi:sugar phosphate nucleotidyltransferase [Psychromonas hadalis]|uniref:sugar phosphate nucleotidyltransferase n=1 Tax=Psychromonas hadalis TaxID=211669 RepID=UPI0003B6C238|nr:sugar phosphate nucleotidyltransferase [Psychromonas hadalis]
MILAGGTGSRLRPLLRALYPKQCLRLQRKDSLLQQTLLRLCGLATQKVIVVW